MFPWISAVVLVILDHRLVIDIGTNVVETTMRTIGTATMTVIGVVTMTNTIDEDTSMTTTIANEAAGIGILDVRMIGTEIALAVIAPVAEETTLIEKDLRRVETVRANRMITIMLRNGVVVEAAIKAAGKRESVAIEAGVDRPILWRRASLLILLNLRIAVAR